MSPGRALPLRHRSYWLMRQTKNPPTGSRPVPKVGRCRRRAISGAWKGTGAAPSAHFRRADWSMLGLMNTLQLQFLMLIFAGWVNRGQQDVIAYLQDLEAAKLPSKPGTPRAAGSKARALHRSSAPPPRSEGHGDRPKRALRDQHLGDARHLASVVSQADRRSTMAAKAARSVVPRQPA